MVLYQNQIIDIMSDIVFFMLPVYQTIRIISHNLHLRKGMRSYDAVVKIHSTKDWS